MTVALTVSGCGAATSPPPAAPANAKPSASPAVAAEGRPQQRAGTPAADVWAAPGALREEPRLDPAAVEGFAGALPPAPGGVTPANGSCVRLPRKAPRPAPCTDARTAAAALGNALALPASSRDDGLAALEGCGFFPMGLVRVLRADLAPLACAEALAGPLAQQPPQGLLPVLHHAAAGLVLASRLSRVDAAPPVYKGPSRRDEVLAFVRGPLAKHLREQAAAVEATALAGARLRSYGRAVAALEAGSADLRLVEAMRRAPVPAFLRDDAELREVYEAALEQALDPRKARGRDALLVALRDFAHLGVLASERVRAARTTLGAMFAGRRVDALDDLLLPDAPAVAAADPVAVLAQRLPTFYAALLFRVGDAGPGTVALGDEHLASLATQGLFPAARAHLGAATAPALRQLHGRARLASAVLYLRAVDVDEAVRALAPLTPADRGDEGQLLYALALALHGGPEDAAGLMRAPPEGRLFPGSVGALDALAEARGPLAPLAQFDAAYVKRLAAPQAPAPDVWREVEARFLRAAEALALPAQKDRARSFAREAAQLRQAVPTPG